MHKPSLEVCLSPALLHLYDTNDAIVVIIDIFRATSTITAALHNGAKCVIPVASVAECINIGNSIPNSITAGERDGKIAEGLQHGNSPLEYPADFIKDKTLVLTTTNGTRLLHMVQGASEIVSGSFLNLGALCGYLRSQNKKVLLGCASWKDKFNLEDTLFAGAVIHQVKEYFTIHCDASLMAEEMYLLHKNDMYSFIRKTTHWHRLAAYGLEKDLEYCVTENQALILPHYNKTTKALDGILPEE